MDRGDRSSLVPFVTGHQVSVPTVLRTPPIDYPQPFINVFGQPFIPTVDSTPLEVSSGVISSLRVS